ncbi:MAG: L-seryl-tRNA(Sec) selenium transferase, partial [Gemmatimonadetes bacterium]|nr:L-seryl-tRNA(Sec) selenium transferase [Gemmatimonadota bacterium]
MNEAKLPSVDQILKQVADLLQEYDRAYVVELVRRCIADVRRQVRAGTVEEERAPLYMRIERAVRHCIEQEAKPRLHRVVNATGVVLHTGLGRAPLPQAAQAAVAR